MNSSVSQMIVRRVGAQPASAAEADSLDNSTDRRRDGDVGSGNVARAWGPGRRFTIDDRDAGRTVDGIVHTPDSLARLVAADPADARSHLTRVGHLVDLGDADATYGAVVDAFLAFGPSASGLRRRVLGVARLVLDPERHALLLDAVDEGLRSASAIPPATHSVLDAGIRGTTDLVRRR